MGKSIKHEMPQLLKETPMETGDFLRHFNISEIKVGRNSKFILDIHTFPYKHVTIKEEINYQFDRLLGRSVSTVVAKKPEGTITMILQDYCHPVNYVWFEDDGTCWTAQAKFDSGDDRRHLYLQHGSEFILAKFSGWKQCQKLVAYPSFLQDEDQLNDILKRNNRYAYEFCYINGCHPGVLLMAPELEILHKAGYSFASRFFNTKYSENPSEVEMFNRLCQPGTSPKTIFKTTRPVYETLKNERELKIWDEFRKMLKFGRITKENIQMVYESGINYKEIGLLQRILGCTYEGKQVFTWDRLIAYLQRVDTYEAIGRGEALQLLADYLNMCRTLNIKPKTDSDSLKREHDVAARQCRQVRNERMAKNMQAACNDMAKYNYKEQIFSATAIESYDDLMDEATQQRNCVASYAQRIANRQTMIFKVRETAHPNRSLITVELDPKTLNIKQKLLACNRPIRSRAQSEFLDRWVRTIKQQRAAA